MSKANCTKHYSKIENDTSQIRRKSDLVSFCHSKLISALVHPDRGTLHIGLDRVHHLSLQSQSAFFRHPWHHLVMDHGSEVLEDLIDVSNVGFELGNAPFPLLQILEVLLLLQHQLIGEQIVLEIHISDK